MVLGAIPGVAASQAGLDGPAAQIDGRFDVGGRAIRLACRGHGAPTVVVDAGLGTAPVEDPGWQAIADRVAPVTRICLQDRAGLGASDPAPEGVRTSLHAATDLHAALRAAGIAPPYLLAAHSIGGLHAQVFASRYPSETAGLVLISTTHPDQVGRWLAQLPPEATGEEVAITDARAFLTRMANDPSANEERLEFNPSAAMARALVSLGDKPVIIATHSPRFRMVPGLSEPLALRLEAQTQDMQSQLLGLSSNAVQNIAAEAGHGLPHEAPAFVVDNILQGVAAVRAQGGEADASTPGGGDAATFRAFPKPGAGRRE
nr:alpha/beta hydrolase [Luteimonas saliphila]